MAKRKNKSKPRQKRTRPTRVAKGKAATFRKARSQFRKPTPVFEVKSTAAYSAEQQAQKEKKPDTIFWAAMALVFILSAGMLFISLSSGGEPVAPLKSVPIQKEPPAQQPALPEPQPAGPVSSATYDNAHFLGNAEAEIIMVEYSDFQCPFCAQAQPTLMQIRQDYPQIKHVFRNYPLASHPSAGKAAEAAECAGLQGKFWEMHDGLFASQNSLSVDSLKEYALGLFLDQAEFDSCLGSNKTAQAVAAQAAEAASVGVRATPSFLVFSKSGANEAARKKAQEEAQALSARYSQFRLPVNTVEVQGAGLGIVFAGALQYSDFAEVLSAFGASPQAKAE